MRSKHCLLLLTDVTEMIKVTDEKGLLISNRDVRGEINSAYDRCSRKVHLE